MFTGIGTIVLLCVIFYVLTMGRYRAVLWNGREQRLKKFRRQPAYLIFENNRIAKEMEIYEFANYLFRTDIEQRWTTDEINRNLCIWADGEMRMQHFSIDFCARKNLMVQLINHLDKETQTKVFAADKMKDRISSLNIWFLDEDLGNVDWINDKMAQEIIYPILEQLGESEKIVPLCVVVHQDEGTCHAHFLYFWKDVIGEEAEVLGIVKRKIYC